MFSNSIPFVEEWETYQLKKHFGKPKSFIIQHFLSSLEIINMTFNCEQLCLQLKEELKKRCEIDYDFSLTVSSTDWKKTILEEYKNFHDFFTDIEEEYKVVIPLYRVLHYSVGEGVPVTINKFIDEYLKTSIFFKNLILSESEAEQLIGWLFTSFKDCVIGWGEYA